MEDINNKKFDKIFCLIFITFIGLIPIVGTIIFIVLLFCSERFRQLVNSRIFIIIIAIMMVIECVSLIPALMDSYSSYKGMNALKPTELEMLRAESGYIISYNNKVIRGSEVEELIREITEINEQGVISHNIEINYLLDESTNKVINNRRYLIDVEYDEATEIIKAINIKESN